MSSESPIMQVPEPEESYNNEELIYQQHQDDLDEFDNHDTIPQKLKLDLRGTRMELHRDTLINLPESLLIAMFPNGLVLARPHEDSMCFMRFLDLTSITRDTIDSIEIFLRIGYHSITVAVPLFLGSP